ncbi:hypothetical protein BDA96_04G381500 [Sorghum bicolor]|uniref:Zinc finger PHD-type domain-containing protein n=1 Tax=Sorghum bicolor TaxID=4558 RepID=A0A921R9T6_SORBI|nr:hypothetical protein BDA96_04G381500 [Sorghum bicolor]
MPSPSSAECLAALWVADTLAAGQAFDFAVIKALVGASPEHFIGAPDSSRERVALRCLEEHATFADADEGGAAVAPPPSKILRVDAVRSCEDLLAELTGQVGSSGILDKDIILPFRQDIQNFICIKKPTLPESSLELLGEVDPEIQSKAAPSSVEQNGIKKHGNHQSLCSVHHLNSNIDTPPPIASTELHPGNLTNLVINLEKGNFKQCPIESTVDLDKPLETDRRVYNQPWEYAINAASVGTRASEKDPSNVDSNMSGSSTSCNATLQGNIAEPLSKKSMVDETTVVQAQPCKGKSPNPSDYNNVIKKPNDDGISYQSSKDSRHESKTLQATMTPAFDRSCDVLPTNTSEASNLPEPIATEDTTMVQQPHSCKTHLNHLQHDSGQQVYQDLDGTASIQPVEKYSIHEESTLRATSAIPSVSCNGAMQEDRSKTNYPSGNSTEHPAIFEEQYCDKSQLKVSCADKNKHTLHDDATMLGKNKVVCGGLNVQGAPESHSCKLTLHDKISEAHCLSDQNIGKSTDDIQKRSFNISVSISCQDGYKKTARQDSNKETIRKTVAVTSHAHSSDNSISGFAAACLLSMSGKIPLCSQDQEANDSLRVSPEQNLCIKCGKGGQLLQCSSCLLSAHESCFASSLTFEDPRQLYCPVCICAKATEEYKKVKKTYIEARKSLAAFVGAEQLLKQHEQQNSVSETTVDDLAHEVEESNRQRKKQKINVTSDACNEVVIEKASSVGNSAVAPMNASVLQDKSNQLQDAEQDHLENTEAHEGSSSQNRCSPAANPEVETDKEDGPTHSHHQSKDSDEIEFTSSSDSGKPSSPPWHTIKHHRARLQEREATVSSNSTKAFGQKDQHEPLPSRKRNYAYAPKRYSNPIVLTGRRPQALLDSKGRSSSKGSNEKIHPTGQRAYSVGSDTGTRQKRVSQDTPPM